MARRNKKKGNQRQPIKKTTSFNPIASSVKAAIAVGRDEKIPIASEVDFNPSLAEKFLKELPEKNYGEFRLWLENFSNLGNEMKNKITEVKKLKDDTETEQLELLGKEEKLENEKKSLRPQLDDLEKRKKELEAQQSELTKKQEKMLQQKAELLEKEQELDKRELNARLNFTKEREDSLSQLKEEIASLEAEENQLKTEIKYTKITLSDTQREKEAELDEKQLEIESNEKKLSREKSRLKREWNDIEEEREEIQSEIEEAVQKEREHGEKQINREQKRAAKAFVQVTQIQYKLDEYQDLERRLKGESVETLLEDLNQLRADKKDLQHKLANTDTACLEEDNQSLQNQVHQLESRLREIEPELGQLKGELSRQHLGIMDKQRLVEEKKVLEKHKQVLTAQLNDLSTKIDELTESQQAQSAFPALSSMDAPKYGLKPPHLEEIPKLKEFAPELQRRIAYAEKEVVLHYSLEDIQLLLGGLAMTQLHVFQGISGTGKTSLAKAFAKAMGGSCTDIAIQAGWRDRDDLLGHYNAFEKRFYEKDCLQGLYQAQTPKHKDCCNVILLDEMNLSRPEQYFAEFLSALEKNNPDERLITLAEAGLNNAPKLLFKNRKIKVPENIWFIGTANHDETTNELADKTYDRSHIMVLPRHEAGGDLEKIEPQQFSYSSLKQRFKDAQDTNKKEVEELLLELTTGSLTQILESQFDLGWGNRFERQALQFIPVVMSAGGSKEMALDHLLATRIFRHGKVTGRYDISLEEIKSAKEALVDLWKDWRGEPRKCLELLNKDERSKGHGR